MHQDKGTELSTEETQPKEKSAFAERVAKFRQTISEKIRQEQPLYLTSTTKHGDALLTQSALMEVLHVLCQQEGLNPEHIHLVSNEPDEQNINELSELILQVGMATKVLDRKTRDEGTFYQQRLWIFSVTLGVNVAPEVYDLPPRLWRSESGPLQHYDEEKVAEYAGRIRETLGNRKVVLLAQSGSSSEKRFSDQQLAQLAEAARKKNPDSFIMLISDKHFLRQHAIKVQQSPSATPVGFPLSTHPSKQEFYTEEEVSNFYTELTQTVTPQEGNQFDYVDEPSDINEILAYMRAADEGVFTDSFWMHLAATQDIQTFITLFTLFNPDQWAEPGSIIVESAAIQERNAESITSTYYHQSESYQTEESSRRLGIEPADMEKLLFVVDNS